MKKQVFDTCVKHRYVSPFENMLGFYETKDEQVENTYCAYSDIAMETLLLKCQPAMEKATGLKLYPAYSYARAYKKGDELKRHKDRFSCEISTTMNLGGDPWPIYLEPSGETGKKGVQVNLKQGDMLVYRGIDLEHWREKFKGKECVQVFLHYNDVKDGGTHFKYQKVTTPAIKGLTIIWPPDWTHTHKGQISDDKKIIATGWFRLI